MAWVLNADSSYFPLNVWRSHRGHAFDRNCCCNCLRYVKSVPTGQWLLMPFNIPKFQPPFLQYEVPFPQMGQIPRAQAPLNYGPSSNPSISHYCMMGSNHASWDAIYMQWPSPAMMYAHSYGQFHHSLFQVI